MRTLATLLLLACLAGPLGATTYYVATDGDNEDAGDINNPWETIAYAMSTSSGVEAGDTVYVRAGSYNESVQLQLDGSSGSRITLAVYPTESVTVTGWKALTVWFQCASDEAGLTVGGVTNPKATRIYKHSVAEADIGNIEAVWMIEDVNVLRIAYEPNQPTAASYYEDLGSYTAVADEGGNLGQKAYLVDSANFTQADDYWNGARFMHFWMGQSVLNYGWGYGYSTSVSDFVAADDKLIFGTPALSQNFYSTGDRYALLNHPHIIDGRGEFYHTTTPDEGNYTVYLWPWDTDNLSNGKIKISKYEQGIKCATEKGDYHTVQGFTFDGYSAVYERAIVHLNYTTGSEAVDCNVYNCASQACAFRITAGSDNTFERCDVNTLARHRGMWASDGAQDVNFIDCNITRTQKTSMYMTGAQDSIITGCTISGPPGVHGNSLSLYTNCDEILVAYNRIVNSTFALTLNASANITVLSNIFDGTEDKIIAQWSACTGDLVFCNNLVYGAPVNKDGFHVSASNWSNMYVYNNTFCGDGHGGNPNVWTSLNWDEDEEDFEPEGSREDSYLYDGNSGRDGPTDLWTDPASDDFTLKTDSPLINKGIDVSSYYPTAEFPDFDFTKDLAGNPRVSGGAIDIGPYEYQEGGSTQYLFIGGGS